MRLIDYVNFKYEENKENESFIIEDENDTPRIQTICDCTSNIVKNNLQRDCLLIETTLNKDILKLERNVF